MKRVRKRDRVVEAAREVKGKFPLFFLFFQMYSLIYEPGLVRWFYNSLTIRVRIPICCVSKKKFLTFSFFFKDNPNGPKSDDKLSLLDDESLDFAIESVFHENPSRITLLGDQSSEDFNMVLNLLLSSITVTSEERSADDEWIFLPDVDKQCEEGVIDKCYVMAQDFKEYEEEDKQCFVVPMNVLRRIDTVLTVRYAKIPQIIAVFPSEQELR